MGTRLSLLIGDDRWAPNAAVPPPPPAATVADVLASAVARWPSRRAFVCADEDLTYADVAGLAARAEHQLRAAGIGRGQHVVIWMANCADFLGWYFGTARLGATLVPLHTRSTAREAGALFATTPPSAFIVGDGEGGPRPADVGEVLRHPALAEAGVPVLDGRIPTLAPSGAARGTSAARASDTFLIKFTSGSSSAPKGVRLSHESIVRNAYNAGARLGLDDRRRLLQPDAVLPRRRIGAHDPHGLHAWRHHRHAPAIRPGRCHRRDTRSPLYCARRHGHHVPQGGALAGLRRFGDRDAPHGLDRRGARRGRPRLVGHAIPVRQSLRHDRDVGERLHDGHRRRARAAARVGGSPTACTAGRRLRTRYRHDRARRLSRRDPRPRLGDDAGLRR